MILVTIIEKAGRDKLAVLVSAIKKLGFSDALLKERLDPPLLAVSCVCLCACLLVRVRADIYYR